MEIIKNYNLQRLLKYPGLINMLTDQNPFKNYEKKIIF